MTVALTFAQFWQQQELSDVTLQLLVEPAEPTDSDATATPAKSTPTVLQRFPAHQVLLSSSPYFKAQVGVAGSRYGCRQPGGPYSWFRIANRTLILGL